MVRSKSAKRFERLAHTVMILVTICIVLPFILLFMSSITSESALVRDGYSFFPKEFSIHAYKFIWDNAANVFRAYGITILVTVIGTFAQKLRSDRNFFGFHVPGGGIVGVSAFPEKSSRKKNPEFLHIFYNVI